MAVNEIPETNVTYEELIQLELEFNDVEDEIGKSINSTAHWKWIAKFSKLFGTFSHEKNPQHISITTKFF